MIRIAQYLGKLLSTIKLPKIIVWLMKSVEDKYGKTSGKRIAGANAMLLVSYIVISHVSWKTAADEALVGILLSFAAAAFAIDYIPRKENDGQVTSKPNE